MNKLNRINIWCSTYHPLPVKLLVKCVSDNKGSIMATHTVDIRNSYTHELGTLEKGQWSNKRTTRTYILELAKRSSDTGGGRCYDLSNYRFPIMTQKYYFTTFWFQNDPGESCNINQRESNFQWPCVWLFPFLCIHCRLLILSLCLPAFFKIPQHKNYLIRCSN